MFPNLNKIASIGLTIPVSTASVESSFSQMKMIKTRLRNSLSDCGHSHLMRSAIEAPEVLSESDLLLGEGLELVRFLADIGEQIADLLFRRIRRGHRCRPLSRRPNSSRRLPQMPSKFIQSVAPAVELAPEPPPWRCRFRRRRRAWSSRARAPVRCWAATARRCWSEEIVDVWQRKSHRVNVWHYIIVNKLLYIINSLKKFNI